MKINEVEQLNEGVVDRVRSGIYNTLGVGGEKGNAAANMYKFRDGFTQQYKQSVAAAKDSGLPMDYGQFIKSYLNKYGWKANQQQYEYLMSLANDPRNLSKAMYAVGMSQKRDPQGYIVGDEAEADAQAAQPTQKKQELTKQLQQAEAELEKAQEKPELSPTTQQIIISINRLVGPESLDDLIVITKTAMQMLYKQNKEKYNELFKEITTGQKSNNTQAEQIAARRVEKLKAAIKAADAEAMPFSRLGGAKATANATANATNPSTPADFAAIRKAKQQAAIDAINGTKRNTLPATIPKVEPAAGKINKVPGTSPVMGPDGKPLPTEPSKNPRQVPGALTFPNQQQPQTKKRPPELTN